MSKKAKRRKDSESVFTRESFGFVTAAFAFLLFFISITEDAIFASLGTAVCSFLFGLFGFADFFVLVWVFIASIGLILGKNPIRIKWFSLFVSLFFLLAFVTAHAYTATDFPAHLDFGAYVTATYEQGVGGATATPFGAVGAIFVYPFFALITPIPACILFTLGSLALLYYTVKVFFAHFGVQIKVVGKDSLSSYITVKIQEQQQLAKQRKAEKNIPPPAPDNVRSATISNVYHPQPTSMQNAPVPETDYNGQTAPYQEQAPMANGYEGYAPAGGGQPYYGNTQAQQALAMQNQDVIYTDGSMELEPSNRELSVQFLYGERPEEEDYRKKNLIFDENSRFNSRDKEPTVYGNALAERERAQGGTVTYNTLNTGGAANASSNVTVNTYSGLSSRAMDEDRTPYTTEKRVVDGYGEPVRETNYTSNTVNVNKSTGYSVYNTNVYGNEPTGQEEEEKPSFSYSRLQEIQSDERTPFDSADDFEDSEISESDDLSTLRELSGRREDFDRLETQDRFADRGRMEAAERRSAFDADRDFAPAREEDRIDALENDRVEYGDRSNDRRNDFKEMFTSEESREERIERTAEQPSDVRSSYTTLFEDVENERFGENDGETEKDLPPTNVPDFTSTRERSVRAEREPADTTGRGVPISRTQEDVKEEPKKQEPKRRIIREYVKPSLDSLLVYNSAVNVSQEEIESTQRGIIDTLKGFNIQVGIKRVVSGPVFTRYDIELPKSVDIGKIERRKTEIALRIHSKTINIYANFSEGSVSIEVPNKHRATVGLKSLMVSESMKNPKPTALEFAVGVDAEGSCVSADLCKMPHMLVAGTTGSGKSVFLQGMIVSLIMRYSPEEMRLILIDPKWTEFSVYENLPHLMINEIITDAKRAVVALNWCIQEMERRYALFAQMTQKGKAVRNIDEYNAAMENREEKLPKIVMIADEVADLMAQAKNDVESRVARLAAKSRAAGIHLVLATQRPSVNVITGVLKSNLPSRVALRVAAEVDSRVVLDSNGAENLLGSGDMLFKSNGMYEAKRLQGAWVDTPEIQEICDFIRENNESFFDEAVVNYLDNDGKSESDAEENGGGGDDDIEPVYVDALRFVIQKGSVSISMVQRRFKIGFNKAARIVEWMEQNNYISEFDGAKLRKVLITPEEFEEKFGEL